MGCDIHPCIEVRSKRTGKWTLKESSHRWRRFREKHDLSYEDAEKLRSVFFKAIDGRSYTLFAILADVRNYHATINPLFAGRGLPSDASKSTLREIPKDDGDLHSHTYFTLAELLATDWDRDSGGTYEVCVYGDDYLEWKETGKVPAHADLHPDNYDESTREVSHEEMVLMLLGNGPEKMVKLKVNPMESRRRSEAKKRGEAVEEEAPKYRSGPYVKVQAPRTYRQLIPDFVEAIETLKALGEPDDIRVVIAFDN